MNNEKVGSRDRNRKQIVRHYSLRISKWSFVFPNEFCLIWENVVRFKHIEIEKTIQAESNNKVVRNVTEIEIHF
jgi:hypothetical protein